MSDSRFSSFADPSPSLALVLGTNEIASAVAVISRLPDIASS